MGLESRMDEISNKYLGLDEKALKTFRKFQATKTKWESEHYLYKRSGDYPLLSYILNKATGSKKPFKQRKKYEKHIANCEYCQKLYKVYAESAPLFKNKSPKQK